MFKLLKGGAQTFKVFDNYNVSPIDVSSNIINIQPNSHYKIDYILRYFNYLIQQELVNNPDAVNNSYFQIFLEKVIKLVENIVKARKNSTTDYACDKSGFVYSANSATVKDIQQVALSIYNRYQNPTFTYSIGTYKMYQGPQQWGIPSNPTLYNFYYEDFPSSCGTILETEIKDIYDVWDNYLNSKRSVSETTIESLQQRQKDEFDETMAETGHAIEYGDYASNYATVEKLLNNSSPMIDNLLSSSFQEFNIIKNIPDISNYYLGLEFDKTIFSKAIKMSTDMTDLVSRKDMQEELVKMAEKRGKLTGKDLAVMFGVPTETSGSIDIGKAVTNLIKNITATKKLASTPEIMDLMYAKIYQDPNDGERKAEYLDPTKYNKLIIDINEKKDKYLDYLDNTEQPNSRISKYQQNYKPEIIHKGGARKSKYVFSNKQPITTTITQTGGQIVDITMYNDELNKDINELGNLQKLVNDSEKMNLELNKNFFNNKTVFDPDGIEQRNLFLVEMSYIFSILRFISMVDSSEFESFKSELKSKLSVFKKDLSYMWKILNSGINISADQEILKKLMSKSVFTISDFKQFLEKSGIIISPVEYPNEALINNMIYINLVTTLKDKYGSIGAAANALKYLVSSYIAPDIKRKTIDGIYKDLFKYYSEIKDFTNAMESMRETVISEGATIGEIKNSIGQIIARNIDTTQVFIDNILIMLDGYDNNMDSYKLAGKFEQKSRKRLTDASIYMDQMNRLVSSHKNEPWNTIDTELDNYYFPTTSKFSANTLFINYSTFTDEIRQTLKNIFPSTLSNKKLLDIRDKLNTMGGYLEKIFPLVQIVYDFNFTSILMPSAEVELDGSLVNDVKKRTEIINDILIKNGTLESSNLVATTLYNKFSNSNINLDTTASFNFTTLSIYLYETILKNIFSQSDLVFYPELMSRLNISSELEFFLQQFLFIEPKIITKYIEIALDLSDIDPKKYKLKELINRYLSQNIQILNNYGTPSSVNLDTLEKNFQELSNNEYLNYVTQISQNLTSPDKNKIITAIEKRIQYFKNSVGNIAVIKPTMDEIRTFALSIVQVFYSELSSMYQILNSYALENNERSNIIGTITKIQQELTKERTKLNEMKIAPDIGNLDYTITPQQVNDIDDKKKRSDIPNNINEIRTSYIKYKNLANRGLNFIDAKINSGFTPAPTYPNSSLITNIEIKGNDIKFIFDLKGAKYGGIPSANMNKVIDQPLFGQNSTGPYYITNPKDTSGTMRDKITYNTSNALYQLNLVQNTIIKSQDILGFQKIINTTKVLIEIIPDLYGINQLIKRYSANLIPMTYDKTKDLEILRKAVRLLEKVDNELRINSKSMIIMNNFIPPSSYNYVLGAKEGIGLLDTSWIEQDFYKQADPIYNFVSDMTSLYTAVSVILFPQLLDTTLNKYIVDVIKKNIFKQKYSEYLNLDFLNEPTNNIIPVNKQIDKELTKSSTRASTEKNKYPIKFPNPKDLYEEYFSNQNNQITSFIYRLIFITNATNIKPYLNKTDEIIQDIQQFGTMVDRYVQTNIESNKSNIQEITENSNLTNESNVNRSKTLIDQLAALPKIGTTTEIANKFFDSEFDNLIDTIKTDVETEMSKNKSDTPYTEYIGTNYILDNTKYDNIKNASNQDLLENIITINKNTTNNDEIYKILRAVIAYFVHIVFEWIDNKIDTYFTDISNNLSSVKIIDLEQKMMQSASDYIDKRDIVKILHVQGYYSKQIGTDNSNAGSSKYIYYSGPFPMNSKIKENFLLVDNMILSMVRNIKKELGDNTKKDYELFQNVLTLKAKIWHIQKNNQKIISEKLDDYNELLVIINKVMFGSEFKETAFMNSSDLRSKMSSLIRTTRSIDQMINTRLTGILKEKSYYEIVVSQQNAYSIFTGAMGIQVGTDDEVFERQSMYKQMSFGLVEFYYDIIKSILNCIENKSYSDMTRIEKYLYEYHYIQLKRCEILFSWIINDYLTEKINEEADYKRKQKSLGQKIDYSDLILKKKIQIRETQGDIRNIFSEFNSLKHLLEGYQSTVMPKVSLHMRINDFATQTKTDTEPDLIDYDPSSIEYDKFLREKKQVFYNSETNKNKLIVNFPVAQNIERKRDPEINLEKSFPQVYNKMQGSNPGILFERIYNSIDYPDSDIISNYMSLAPNIKNFKGTMIMTYGYSGVGKSASLFGVPANPSKNISAKAGILQTTLDQLVDNNIYFRVFEIYGLGTQFDFYWNPKETPTSNDLSCFPEFYQMVIHHDLNKSGSSLKLNNSIPITNRSDIYSYILNMRKPDQYPPNTIPKEDAKVNNNGGFRTEKFNEWINDDGSFTSSSYITITQQQYQNFPQFVDNEIEKNRMKDGVTIRQVFEDTLLQVKGTVNNDKSSRSILVYDFQIEIKDKQGGTSFVPFVIYDLPGKEDLFKTYVYPTQKSAPEGRKQFAFDDIPGDTPVTKDGTVYEIKNKKSTYVTNPLLCALYNDKYGDNFEHTKEAVIAAGNQMQPKLVKKIIKKVMNFEIITSTYNVSPTDYKITEANSNSPIKISDFYNINPKNPINTFDKLFDNNSFNPELIGNKQHSVTNQMENTPYYIFTNLGMISYYPYAAQPTKNHLEITFIQVMIVLIEELIRRKLFDVIVRIIYAVVNKTIEPNKNANWSIEKIYAFSEAFYINENVIGLLQYLISTHLEAGPSSVFEKQKSETTQTTISNNYRFSNIFQFIQGYEMMNRSKIDITLSSVKLPKELIDTSGVSAEEKIEIEKFLKDFGFRSDGSFIYDGENTKNAFEAMRMAIYRQNKGTYNSNKIFREGLTPCPGGNQILDPETGNPIPEYNYPLLKDFIEPYSKSIDFYYVFYVVSNTFKELKSVEQIKLLNNSMPFIEKLNAGKSDDPKKNNCVR